MSENKRYNFKQILQTSAWILVGAGIMVLLGAAMYKKNNSSCKSVEITIEGVKNNFFMDKSDVNTMLEKMNFGKLRMKPLNSFDLIAMETLLEKNKWVKSAELYFDNNDVLRIKIMEREPIARIFTTHGSSFYIDSSLEKLPLSSKFSARLPVFTNFPVNVNFSSKADSSLLSGIKNISIYISEDSFWMAQIDQVDITPRQTFEMIPKIGNQVIIFGSDENYQEKFNHLLIFYKDVESKVGWNKYSTINVSYKKQVVALKRGAGDIKQDSLKTIQLIKILVENAKNQVSDSTTNIQLVQPKEDNIMPMPQPHEENFIDEQPSFNDTLPSKKIFNYNPKITPVINKSESKPLSTPVKNSNSFSNIKSKSIEKPIPVPVKKNKIIQVQKQSKSVMKLKNDY